MTRSGLLKRASGFAVAAVAGVVAGPTVVAEAERQRRAKRMGKALGEAARRGVMNAVNYAPIRSEQELERLVTEAVRERQELDASRERRKVLFDARLEEFSRSLERSKAKRRWGRFAA